MHASFTLRIVTVFFVETIGDFLLFPFWWYTMGLWRTLRGLGRALSRRSHALALGLWIANLFKPMYGQEDWQGKLVSLFFRFLILFWRLFLLLVWVVVLLIACLFYVALPAIAIYGIIQNL